MTRSLRLSACLVAALATLPALAADAPDKGVIKPVKLVIEYVRQSKDDKAVAQFANEEQGKLLLGEEWSKGTPAQRKEFTQLFNTLFKQMAFPKIRENFKHLDAVNYGATQVTGGAATADSLIVIDHPVKKQELKLKFALTKEGSAWKVVDVRVLGDSMLTGIREDQIKPIMANGGWNNLLTLMRSKAKEVSK